MKLSGTEVSSLLNRCSINAWSLDCKGRVVVSVVSPQEDARTASEK